MRLKGPPRRYSSGKGLGLANSVGSGTSNNMYGKCLRIFPVFAKELVSLCHRDTLVLDATLCHRRICRCILASLNEAISHGRYWRLILESRCVRPICLDKPATFPISFRNAQLLYSEYHRPNHGLLPGIISSLGSFILRPSRTSSDFLKRDFYHRKTAMRLFYFTAWCFPPASTDMTPVSSP